MLVVNENNGRSGVDANTILGSISTFDATAGCDDVTFQPCSDRALLNHKVVTDAFRPIYQVNAGLAAGQAVAVGRYPEDTYQGGNPWYLITLAAAEQLYDALYVFDAQGRITVTNTSLPFFQDLVPDITIGTYFASNSSTSTKPSTFTTLHDAISAYADGFVQFVATYAQSNGSLSEQFSKSEGSPLSAYDLTWSYAAVLTAAARQGGEVPASWGAPTGNTLPETCEPTFVVGTYSLATITSFPQGSVAPGPCPCDKGVNVTFNELVTTVWGQTIKIIGNTTALGNWDQNHAVALSAADYNATNPLWHVTINLPAGHAIEYKYINVQPDGSVQREARQNRVYKVPATCGASVTKWDLWE